MTTAIEVRHLTKRYGDLAAVDDISVDITKNAITGLLGRNGAGKTVLMSLMTDQERPTSGSVSILGAGSAASDNVLSRISFVRDNQRYPDEYKLAHLLRIAPVFHENWDADLAAEIIERFEIPAKRTIRKMSRGQLSAVGALLGIASRAPITLFDEPYLGMDATARVMFYDLLLRDYAEHPRTIVISTHLIDEMEPLLERVVVLDHGRLRVDASVDELRSSAHVISGVWRELEPLTPMALHTNRLGAVGTLLIEGHPELIDQARASGLDVVPASLQQLVAAYGLADHAERNAA